MSIDYPFHEIADLFPLMRGPAFEELKASIADERQKLPIWLYQGRIIDGRNRYRACRELGIEPVFAEWDGVGSLVAFVQALNLTRRHLDDTHRAVVAVKLKQRYEAEAKERMMRGKSPSTDPRAHVPEGAVGADAGRARDRAAIEMGVSPRTVENAARVLRDGSPALREAVESGAVKVRPAAEVSSLPVAEQERIAAAGPAAIVRAAKQVRVERVTARRVGGDPKRPRPRTQADDDRESVAAYAKWTRTANDLQIRCKGLTDDEVRILRLMFASGEAEDAVVELRGVRGHHQPLDRPVGEPQCLSDRPTRSTRSGT